MKESECTEIISNPLYRFFGMCVIVDYKSYSYIHVCVFEKLLKIHLEMELVDR